MMKSHKFKSQHFSLITLCVIYKEKETQNVEFLKLKDIVSLLEINDLITVQLFIEQDCFYGIYFLVNSKQIDLKLNCERSNHEEVLLSVVLR